MLVCRSDIRKVGRDPLDGPTPQVPGVGEDIVLVHQGEVLAGPGLGSGEGVADDPFDAEGGVDAHLGRDLVRGADPQRTAVADIRALGAFSHDDEVDPSSGATRATSSGLATPG